MVLPTFVQHPPESIAVRGILSGLILLCEQVLLQRSLLLLRLPISCLHCGTALLHAVHESILVVATQWRRRLFGDHLLGTIRIEMPMWKPGSEKVLWNATRKATRDVTTIDHLAIGSSSRGPQVERMGRHGECFVVWFVARTAHGPRDTASRQSHEYSVPGAPLTLFVLFFCERSRHG